MTPQVVRRSGRIAKQVAVLLIGSDTEGRIFSEETKTVVLSRHGAGVVSRYKLAAEDEVIVRLVETGKEAEARIVGQIGSNAGIYTYGVAFVDGALNFWNIDFPPPHVGENETVRFPLACNRCGERSTLDQSELESDVYAINDGIVRYCGCCGFSTVWKRITGSDAQPERPTPPAPRLISVPFTLPTTTLAASETVAAEAVAAETPSFYSGASIAVEEPPVPKPIAPPAASTQVPTATSKTATALKNRRKHARTRVTVAACVRTQNYGDDVAICEDMSRGGLRFKSRKLYTAGATIEIAAPYSPETQSIFVAGKIVFVQEIPDQNYFRYGVAYVPAAGR
jgi:hypothetical protein